MNRPCSRHLAATKKKLARQFEIKRVFHGPEELVVVDVSFAPVLRLVVEDVEGSGWRCRGGTPENGVGVRAAGTLV